MRSKKWVCFICLLCLLIAPGFSQKILTLFQVESIKLEQQKYPWADELHLHVKISKVHPILNNHFLTVTVLYEGNRVRWYTILLQSEKKGRFSEFKRSWGPINSATQEILKGRYTVKIEFLIANQDRKKSERLRKNLTRKKRKIRSYQKTFSVGTRAQYRKQIKERKAFYIDNMKILNGLLSKLYEARREALYVEDDVAQGVKNRFVSNKKFSLRIWETWFQNSFIDKVREQRRILSKRPKQYLALQYPQTRSNMDLYCDTLEQMGTVIANSVFKYYKKKQEGAQVRYKKPYSMMQLRSKLLFIRGLHQRSAQEMGIDLREALGFMPPPPPPPF